MFASDTKILVVEDSALFRNLLRENLHSLGFKNVVIEADGSTALPKLEECLGKGEHFKIIIADWMMPGMSGDEFLKKCKKHDGLKHIPFIIVTAQNLKKKEFEIARELGVTEFVQKPFRRDDLEKALMNVYKEEF